MVRGGIGEVQECRNGGEGGREGEGNVWRRLELVAAAISDT